MKTLLVLLFGLPVFAVAQLRVAKMFSDNMVIQRGQPVQIWGKAIPGKQVSVTFARENRNAIAGNDSAWKVVFKKQTASTKPQTVLVVSGTETVELKNVLVGDVWLCIGQSNMEWPMVKEMHYKEEIQNSHQPLIRLYNPVYAGKNIFNEAFTDSTVRNLTPGNFYIGAWQSCDSSSFKMMSAVAYYFGKQVAHELNVPVGLINLSIGGAPLETFISAAALKSSPRFAEKINGDWLDNDVLPVWVRERGKQNLAGLKNVAGDEYGSNHGYKPGFAWEAGIAPMLKMPVKGILCYQGESNAQEIERVNEYATLSALMVADYRAKFKQPQLPFFYVQLSSIDTLKYKGQLWPEFREEQRKMLQLIANSGMAVCSDLGFRNDVHPTNKKDVGERLARWALHQTYHKDIVPSGPLPLQATYDHGKVIISFQYTGNKLATADDQSLRGFSIDGINDCAATLQNNRVEISVLEKPSFVYYGWKSFTDANLVNSENLPASTFKLKVN